MSIWDVQILLQDDEKEEGVMQAFLMGIVYILIYFIICASGAFILRMTTKVPDEVFRKLLHMILLGSLSVWVAAFPNWWMAAISAVAFALLVYPVLWAAESIKGYSKVVTERKSGELKSSLLIVFFMFAVVVSICWGWFSDKMLALASIYAWGFGDAFAALIGKRFGKHKIGGKIIAGRKSVEGTGVMFIVSFVSVFTVLMLRGGMEWYACGAVAIVTAAVSAIVELYTLNGIDTITCPLAAMAVLLPLVHLFGGI